jgi:hypothetical protein
MTECKHDAWESYKRNTDQPGESLEIRICCRCKQFIGQFPAGAKAKPVEVDRYAEIMNNRRTKLMQRPRPTPLHLRDDYRPRPLQEEAYKQSQAAVLHWLCQDIDNKTQKSHEQDVVERIMSYSIPGVG